MKVARKLSGESFLAGIWGQSEAMLRPKERIKPMKIAVYGSGSWGTALGQTLTDNGHQVTLYGVDREEIRDIRENHRNSRYFDDHILPENLLATEDIREATENAEALVLAVPSHFLRDALEKGRPYIGENTLVINAAKGFDWEKNCRLTDTVRDVLAGVIRRPVASVIGPSHAEEVIRRMVTSICAVSTDEETARTVQRLFSGDYLRLYVNLDEVGAEYGAAVKNVIAIASGILVGRGYGDNAKAALVTRGLLEMIRYGCSKGGNAATYTGLTGLGDLVVTCFSVHSRNYRAGLEIGKRDDAASFLRENRMTVEGINSCKVIYEDLKKAGTDMELPIVEALYRVLYEGKRPSDEIAALMMRPLKAESAEGRGDRGKM